MKRFFKHLRVAFLRALEHDQYSVAKGAAYSAILTVFPAVLLLTSILTLSHTTRAFLRQTTYAFSGILPQGIAPWVLTFFEGHKPAPIGMIITTALVALWTGSGVMVSWMDGFRRAYEMPRIWNALAERMVSLLLLLLAGLPMAFASFLLTFGSQIEQWLGLHANQEIGIYLLATWTVVRWLIATLTAVAVIALIYHHGLPRTQPWHRVVPGSMLATGLWIVSTTLFGFYLRHYADYRVIYGSVGTAIALLVWLFMISYIILIGAEFNAVRYPRYLFGTYSKLETRPGAGGRHPGAGRSHDRQ